mmetsp:Transcript_10869/g.32102  ORF Transcript_10869/g.32102 Transcript_10869/m.32102 type:complete len:330 (+) Transcript_10869:2671-3660(+)
MGHLPGSHVLHLLLVQPQAPDQVLLVPPGPRPDAIAVLVDAALAERCEQGLPHVLVLDVLPVQLHREVQPGEHVADLHEARAVASQGVVPRVAAALHLEGDGPVEQLHDLELLAVLLGALHHRLLHRAPCLLRGLLRVVLPVALLLCPPRQGALVSIGGHLLADRAFLEAHLLDFTTQSWQPAGLLLGGDDGAADAVAPHHVPVHARAHARAHARGIRAHAHALRLGHGVGRQKPLRRLRRLVHHVVRGRQRVARVQAQGLHGLPVLLVLGRGDLPLHDHPPRSRLPARLRPLSDLHGDGGAPGRGQSVRRPKGRRTHGPMAPPPSPLA